MPEESEPVSSGSEAPPVEPVNHRVKPSLEQRQAEMRIEQKAIKRARRGNPNFQKGVYPYAVSKDRFQQWMQEHPEYERKSNRRIPEVVRMFLFDTSPIKSHRDKTRLQVMLEQLYKTAINSGAKNQVAAAMALFNRAFGKEQASDADLEAIKKGGLTVVYVDRPAIDPDIPVIDGAAQHALPPPEFIEAEFSEDDNGPR